MIKNKTKLTSIKKGEKICSLDQLINKKAIVIEDNDKYLPGIIIYKNNNIIKSWINNCPHANLTLDLIKGKIQSKDGNLLCANHGAKFDPETGVCLKGPCKEKYLTIFPFVIENNNLIAGS